VVNVDVFVSFTRQALVPALRPGETVVMDNLSSHKVAAVREAIASAGARLLYLPPYSSDLNPIEPTFSKIKQKLGSIGHRLVDELRDRMQEVLDAVTPRDAEGFFTHFTHFRHCGYPRQIK